jgi:UDP-glucose 4-epimerase
MPGVTVTVSDRCTGCGFCLDGVCFVDAIHLIESRVVHTQACRGCGHCATVCPSGAIEIAYENDRIVQDSIARLSRLVDLS